MEDVKQKAQNEEILEPDLVICDAHHHIWDWPGNEYLLSDFFSDTGIGYEVPRHSVDSTVYVECQAFYHNKKPEEMNPVGETEYIANIASLYADKSTRVCEAIVGHADLCLGAAVDKVLETHIETGGGYFRGIRHAGAWDPSEEVANSLTNPGQSLYRDPRFQEGFSKLGKYDLTFDAWLYHPQLPDLVELAKKFPETKIILNHVGGPIGIGPYTGRRDEVFGDWLKGIKSVADCPNVYVKLGGLGMVRCGFDFHKRDFLPDSEELAEAWRPYIETCIDLFGVERGIFESNYPADRPSCTYNAIWNAFKRITSGATNSEKARLYRDNARSFYRLS